MSEKIKVFKKLLPVKQQYMLYSDIGTSVLSDRDLNSYNYDKLSLTNTIRLLKTFKWISYNSNKDRFFKEKPIIKDYDNFLEIFFEKLQTEYEEAFEVFGDIDILYEETKASLYFKRNTVSLDFSGFLMVLNDLGVIESQDNDIYITDKSILKWRVEYQKSKKKALSIQELKIQLEEKELLGDEAEIKALEFENENLKLLGINRSAERISEYNVSAGYDIVSYKTKNSKKPDKFIEVKSCADNRWNFFISKNEINVAKLKENDYFLYLYNRNSKEFNVIKNPYDYLFNNQEANNIYIEPQIYNIKILNNLT